MKKRRFDFLSLLPLLGLLVPACLGLTLHATPQVPRNEYREIRWSPDGKSLAVGRRESPEAPFRIAVVPAEGGEPRQVTAEPNAFNLRWSPDGRQISFLVYAEHEGTIDLMVVDADGGQRRRIATSSSFVAGFSYRWMNGYTWAPDGQHFYYFDKLPRPEPGSAHYSMDLTGAISRTPGTITIDSVLSAEWSADQTAVTFESEQKLYIAGSRGENLRVVPGVTAAHAPALSPDGRAVIYTLLQRPDKGLWSIRANGTSKRPLAADGFRGQFSPDGQWIAYLDTRLADVKVTPVLTRVSFFKQICKVRPDGTGMVVLAR